MIGLYKIQIGIVEEFERQLENSDLKELQKLVVKDLLFKSINHANDIRVEDLEKELKEKTK